MLGILLISYLAYNLYYATPFKITTKTFNNENIKVYEPLNLEKNKNLFFTGANSLYQEKYIVVFIKCCTI